MADVLIVCVREDEPQAKALAEMFEAAGFSIGGAPANDAALRSSGAGVIVWSQASIRSRPFLDAAQRVINAEKAVVASLIEPPPASSIGASPAFDLSNWSGDPNDPALDPLFFAVDRMVNAARATVGAGARQEAYPAEAAPAPQPLPRTTSRARPAPAPAAPAPRPASAAPDLKSEAEFWRSIRDSRDPADFMDYIARFGANGTFVELAELKLSQLTGAQPAPAAPAPRPRTAPAVPPTRVRTEPPPARRPEALPPTPRRTVEAPPRRMPPPERAYDRTDYREPKAEGGGALRTFVVVALLGGAALGGGLYLGGGIDVGRNQEQVAEDVPPPASDETMTDIASTEEGPSFLEAERASPIVDAAPSRQAASPPRTAVAESTRPARQDGVGGPISLSPAQPPEPSTQAATTPRSGPVSLVPPQTTTSPETQPASASTPPSVTPPTAATPGRVAWAQRPSARRISDLYPQRALRAGMGGRVQLDCTVQANLTVSCAIASETPPGMGFGAAAISAASAYRAQPRLSNGASAVGSTTRIAIAFQAPE